MCTFKTRLLAPLDAASATLAVARRLTHSVLNILEELSCESVGRGSKGA